MKKTQKFWVNSEILSKLRNSEPGGGSDGRPQWDQERQQAGLLIGGTFMLLMYTLTYTFLCVCKIVIIL